MSWKNQLRSDSLPWLLESDNASVQYLALRDLLDISPESKKLKSARKAAHKEGPIAAILSNMEPEGYWVKPGPGYAQKYRSTVWALILLAQLVHQQTRISTWHRAATISRIIWQQAVNLQQRHRVRRQEQWIVCRG